MLFNSLQFWIFFLPVWLGLRLCQRHAVARVPSFLLAASLLFYTLWYPAYLLLLLVALLVNYALLRAIARSRRPGFPLACSVTFTLGLLAFFKYAALIVESLLPVLTSVLGTQPALPEIFLPLGISFYSFQIIGLAVDTARGRQEPVASFTRYALFISFFPQLIAGPILRGGQLLPQLAAGGEPSPDRDRRGVWLIVTGLVKKVVLADFMLAPFVNDVFGNSELAGAPLHWIALYGFAFQIYFDFSGYTDMARGMALLLGFELPLNFSEPYLARDPSEFWRRWHMTLSQWLRDYVYIPLGGNRRGWARTRVNLLVTMLLGGLWHGAAWNFVIWGGIHGVLLVAHRVFRGDGRDARALGWRDVPAVIVLFHAVCLAWVFFRTPDLPSALSYLQGLAGTGSRSGGWPVLQCGVIALCAALHPLERLLRTRLPALRAAVAARPWTCVVEGGAIGAALLIVWATAGAGGDFIYFQF
jgi:alginate O-acetyltransferase complex protein AlgI